MPSMKIIAVASMFLSFAILMISLATNEWYTIQMSTEKLFRGLWNNCKKVLDEDSVCQFMMGANLLSSNSLTAIRGFLSLAILLLVGAIGYPSFFKQMSSGPVKLGFMSVLCVLSALMSFLGMIIFTHEINSQGSKVKFGWSYILGWVGIGATLVSAVIVSLASREEVYENEIV